MIFHLCQNLLVPIVESVINIGAVLSATWILNVGKNPSLSVQFVLKDGGKRMISIYTPEYNTD